MSLRWRWALTLAAVAAVAIGVIIGASLYATHSQLRGQVDEDLLARVTSASRPGGFEGVPGMRPFGGGPRGVGAIVDLDAVVQIVDALGNVILYLEGDPPIPVPTYATELAVSPGPPVLDDVDLDGIHHRMVTAHISVPGPQRSSLDGAIQVAVDVTDIDDALAALVTQLLAVGGAAVLLAGLVGWFLARHAVRPIEVLTAAAARVAETEVLEAELDTRAPGEIGRLAASFTTMLRSLAESRNQQQRLISDAGHELRTPLTALRTNLETLIRRDDSLDDAQRQELLDAALVETKELSALAIELVDLATDVRHSDEPVRPVNLADLADAVAARFRRRTGRAIVVVALDGENEVPGRAGQLERAISNLIDNATKWSPEDRPIEVAVSSNRLDVRDHGAGIAAEDLPRIFERFYRSTAARTQPGSGLGLAIVKHVVEAHGGRVYAANTPDGGAVVGFEIPEAASAL